MTSGVGTQFLRILLFVLLQDILHVRGLHIQREQVVHLIIMVDLQSRAGMDLMTDQMQQELFLLYEFELICQDWELVSIDYLLVLL